MNTQSQHTRAIFQALLVTFLWSTSWVLIKWGLRDIPALSFAGLRYGLAFLILLPFSLRVNHNTSFRKLSRSDWLQLVLLGLLFFAITQGAQFLGLVYLEAMTASVLLNFTSPVVALFGIIFLDEKPGFRQWFGVALCLIGICLYFFPVQIPWQQAVGILIVLVGVLANAGSSILGRKINRTRRIDPLIVTVISMGIGAFMLIIVGFFTQGIPSLSGWSWLIIVWMAAVNTAFAFTLWNRTLQNLTAVELTVINGTMLIQIAILAWIFLGERLSPLEFVGLLILGIGSVLVQLRNKND